MQKTTSGTSEDEKIRTEESLILQSTVAERDSYVQLVADNVRDFAIIVADTQ